jgi:hypothetical protein
MMTLDEDPTTQEHRIRQSERERDERRQAAEAQSEEESAQAERRADKAAYLRRKLEARAKAERET